jgi:hypothetical protein
VAKNLLSQGMNTLSSHSGKPSFFVKANQVGGKFRPLNFAHAGAVPLVGIDKGGEEEDHVEIRRKGGFLPFKLAPVTVKGKIDLPPGVKKLF